MNNDLYNTVNLKDLPQLEQILPGNFIVVENTAGTNKLDFSDFVIGPSNTSFYTPLANNIVSLSSSTLQLSANLASVSASNETYFKAATSFARNEATTAVLAVTGALTEDTFILTTGNIFLPAAETLGRSEFFPISCIQGGPYFINIYIRDDAEAIRLLTTSTFSWRYALSAGVDEDDLGYTQIILRSSTAPGGTNTNLEFGYDIVSFRNLPVLVLPDSP